MSRSLFALALFTLLAGCEKASSTDIKTSGIYAGITGTADGSGSTTVVATLRLGELSATFVELGAGDTLTAKSGTDSPHAMSKSDFLGLVSYSATLSGDEEGKSVTVALTRAADTSAPNSVLTLPAKFNLLGPAAGTTFGRGKDAISVLWDNAGKAEAMLVQLSGTCIETVTHSGVSDTGSLVIAANELKVIKGKESETCAVEVKVTRTRTGTLDTAYGKGGSVEGVQARTVSVKAGP